MASSTRRSHKKSRKGCAECKRRHIRCDERQPSCVNCEVAERTCSFSQLKTGEQQRRRELSATLSVGSEVSSYSNSNVADEGVSEPAQRPLPALHQQNNYLYRSQTPSRLSAHTPDTLPSVGVSSTIPHRVPFSASPLQHGDVHSPPTNYCPGLSGDIFTADFTVQHLVLLHHAHDVPNLIGPGRSSVDVAFRHASNAPYLIDEVLAFIAFHITSLYPGSTEHLQRLSTELQTRALASFARLTENGTDNDPATAVPRFLFTSILGRHVLSDTLIHCQSDFHYFIDRFVECFDLNRGIRAITPSARNSLHGSEIQPFLDTVLKAEKKITSPGKECDALRRLMDDSDLNEVCVKSCRQAIEVLQWAFDICHHLDEDNYPTAASAFSVRVEAGFLDVLRKHRPEALAILAYYGVLLCRCRTFWAFRDAGPSMIHAISSQLGSYWKEVLAWPLHVLETECN